MAARALGFVGPLVLGLGLTLGAGCAASHDLGGVRVSEGSRGRALEPEAVAERAAGSVGVVITDLGRGLGFVVDPRGYMLTNRHVVEDAEYIERVSFPGLVDAPEFHEVQIVYIDPVRDLALLKLVSDEPLPTISLAAHEPMPVADYVTERDAVVLLSRDVDPDDAAELERDPGLVLHTGRVERLEVYNSAVGPGPFLGVTALVEQGQSGGPVLDRFGRAVGVVTWTWKDQKGGFAIPIAEAARMLAERPKLDTPEQQQRRAEERARAYVAALGSSSVDELRRLTSPSLARETRGRTVTVLLERSTEAPILQGFLSAIDELLAEAIEIERDPFPVLEQIIAHTGSEEFMRDLGVAGRVSPDAVVAFFHEIGSAYASARLFGDYDRRDALLVALQRVHSLDAARSIVLVDTVDELAGARAEIERVDVTPGLYAPQAVATVKLGGGRRVAVQMRLEWGDWYVGELQAIDAG